MKALADRAAEVLARCGLLTALEAADRGTDRVRVVAYHRVDEYDAEPDLDPGLISASPADFRDQMEAIALHYTAISIEQLAAAHRGETPLPPRAVLLTFDDGYQDFEAQAWPILRELGLPAVLFVPTSFPFFCKIKSPFAILVMTGEDEDADGKLNARPNVIHEIGLFQGRLGFNKAIVLLENGTEEFSNINRIQQLRFSKGNIKEVFGDILATLKREFEIK